MCEAEKQLHQEQSRAGSGLLLVQSLPAAGTLLPHLLSSPLVSSPRRILLLFLFSPPDSPTEFCPSHAL